MNVGDALKRDKMFSRFRGRDLSGEDFTGAIFYGSDLRDTILTGCNFRKADFRGAVLDGARMDGCNLVQANLTGVPMKGAVLRGLEVPFHCRMVGADLTGATLEDVEWRVNGWNSRGIIMPEFDPAQISAAYDNNYCMARVLEVSFPKDDEIETLIRAILSQRLACWEGIQEYVLTRIPHRLDDFMGFMNRCKGWMLLERWELAKDFRSCRELKDYESLKESAHYRLFDDVIDRRIEQVREGMKG